MAERLAAYPLSDEDVATGLAWYPSAARACRRLAYRHGTTFHRAAGVVAAASINQSWKGNLTIADSILAGEHCGLYMVQSRVARIVAGESPLKVLSDHLPGYLKVPSFYRSIIGNTDAVCLDRWAAQAAGVTQPSLARKGEYMRVADGYREAAAKVGMTPRDFQASVWVHVRRVSREGAE